MKYAILDCYTDEPAGLGVPPYLGTYPRYIAGYLDEDVCYVTIDDLRLWKKYNGIIKETRQSQKTDITTYNLTNNCKNLPEILQEIDTLIVVLGVHVPAQYSGQAYGLIKNLGTVLKDNWLNDGSLQMKIQFPAGLKEDVYRKINAITNGSAIIKEEVK